MTSFKRNKTQNPFLSQPENNLLDQNIQHENAVQFYSEIKNLEE